MNEIGSTTFGYVIAYLLPGLTASVSGAFFSKHVAQLFSKVIDDQNLALGLMGSLGAIAVGLFLSLFRALIFEEWLWRDDRLSADDYASLASDDQVYKAYDRVTDEAYRFHQFWGGMALALPMLAAGIVIGGTGISTLERIAIVVAIAGCEAGAIWGAAACYRRYLARVQRVLKSA